jgi:hypothetical protein
MTNTRYLRLLLVLLTVVLGACGTFELESDVLTEAQLVTATSAVPTLSVGDSATDAESSATPTSSVEPVADVHFSVTGELTNNCFSITGWTQAVVGDRLVAQPIVVPAGETTCDGTPRTFVEQIVMDQHGFSLEQLAGGSLMLDVAGVVQPLRPLLAPLFATPAPAMVPTPEPQVISIEAFEQMLEEAITTHNYEWMAQLMDDPFSIALWQSQGYTASPAQAVLDLQQTYLPADQEIVFGAAPPDLAPVLGPDKDILDIWDPAANAVSAAFTTGWGPDGATEAFLIISVLDGGIVQWNGIIFAAGELGGFDGE